MDMALFYYGYTLQGGKYLKEARPRLRQAAQELPELEYVPEAHSRSRTTTSKPVARRRRGPLQDGPQSSRSRRRTGYAMYKMGWIHLNLQRFQEALETFFQVAQATKTTKKRGSLTARRRKTSCARTRDRPRPTRPTRRPTCRQQVRVRDALDPRRPLPRAGQER